MEKYLGLKNDDIKVGVAEDQAEYQQQQSSTLSTEGNNKEGLSGVGGGEGGRSRSSELEAEVGKERQRQQGGETETSRSTPPFTEGYGTTGSHEGVEEEKQHGFGNAV